MAFISFQNLVGTMKSFFRIGGPTGNGLKNQADGLGVRNSADSAFVNMSVKAATGSVMEHAANWQDMRDANALIQFSFAGESAPAPGDNPGTYGFCHTSGGAFSAGQVYFDDGTTLRLIKVQAGTRITTTSAVTGTISLVANGIYAAHSSSAPYSWVLKGDGTTGDTGINKYIEVLIGTEATKTSTFSIPAGSRMRLVSTDIAAAYPAGVTISVGLDGSTPLTLQPATENAPSVEATYVSDIPGNITVTEDTAGPVIVTITGEPETGSGSVLVEFSPTVLV